MTRIPLPERPNAAQQAVIDAITKEWAARGKVVEGGWQAFVAVALQGAPPEQLREMRKAYLLGAQHLWASMFAVLDPEAEPTEADMARMSAIGAELEAFWRSLGN